MKTLFTTLWHRYGVLGLLTLARDWLCTRLSQPGQRLIRRPFHVRGRINIQWGAGLTTGVGVRLDAFRNDRHKVLVFGRDVQLNDHVHIAAIEHVSIGNEVLIASRVFISDHDHGVYSRPDLASAPSIAPALRPLSSRPVKIGDRVWLGEQVCVLPGVTIGDGAVIGAGAVVTHDIPANSVAVGNPARVIRVYDPEHAAWIRT